MNKSTYDKHLSAFIMSKMLPSLRRAVLVAARRVSCSDLQHEEGVLTAQTTDVARVRAVRAVRECMIKFERLFAQVWPHAISSVAQEVYNKRDYLDQMCRLPLVEKKKRRDASRVPKYVPLVARRAIAARKKVKEWQRKQKLAATKLKEYRRKEAYYKRKGLL